MEMKLAVLGVMVAILILCITQESKSKTTSVDGHVGPIEGMSPKDKTISRPKRKVKLDIHKKKENMTVNKSITESLTGKGPSPFNLSSAVGNESQKPGQIKARIKRAERERRKKRRRKKRRKYKKERIASKPIYSGRQRDGKRLNKGRNSTQVKGKGSTKRKSKTKTGLERKLERLRSMMGKKQPSYWSRKRRKNNKSFAHKSRKRHRFRKNQWSFGPDSNDRHQKHQRKGLARKLRKFRTRRARKRRKYEGIHLETKAVYKGRRRYGRRHRFSKSQWSAGRKTVGSPENRRDNRKDKNEVEVTVPTSTTNEMYDNSVTVPTSTTNEMYDNSVIVPTSTNEMYDN